jgi:hippurate hydrolase
MANFITEASEIQNDLVAIRRHIHQEPELGLDLPKTQAKILAALEGLGLEVSTGKSLSSVTAVLRAGDSKKTVLLRADMDALPVAELADLPYKSQIDGAMHACGHDLHVAMLIGAAKLLVKNKSQLSGDVVFMFQPGEEGFDGAGHMIKEGVLTASGRKADATYGIHVTSSSIPTGTFTTKPGTMMASADEIHVTVVGMGGHGSQPHTAKDPIPVAAEMVGALQLMITRSFDAFDPVVITVGQFHAGTKANIIPDTAEFQATIRTFSPENRARIQVEAVRLCKSIAEGYGLKAEVKVVEQYPVTVNNDAHAQFVGRVAGELFGNEAYMDMPHAIAGAEDYSRVLEAVPGSYVFLGASVDQDFTKSEANHSPRAKFDDSVLYRGTALLSELAVRSLNEMV